MRSVYAPWSVSPLDRICLTPDREPVDRSRRKRGGFRFGVEFVGVYGSLERVPRFPTASGFVRGGFGYRLLPFCAVSLGSSKGRFVADEYAVL